MAPSFLPFSPSLSLSLSTHACMDRCYSKLQRKLMQSRYIIPFAIGLCLILFYGRPSKISVSIAASSAQNPPLTQPPPRDRCSGRYIYVHDLPSRFNKDLLRDCRSISQWTDMCLFTSNAGLGPPLGNSEGIFFDAGWYATNQFALEVIFHNRMKRYECLTTNSSRASAIFVPFYAGLDVARYLWGSNTSVRDSLSLDLVRWLKSQQEWTAMGGKDHFLVAGRITWDFRRPGEEENSWGGKLLVLPEAKNMTVLVIESSPWHSNDFAIPYPTYFHPSKDSEVFAWQDRMKQLERPWLFSFAGAQRPNQTGSIRSQLIGQCRESHRCKLLNCDLDASKCHSPSSIMKTFQSSVFCLQPPGDSYTRRSAFDSMVAGCVPVFFHPGSAYVQYLWHLPRNYTRYSVFISEDEVREGKVSIEEALSRFTEEQVRAMRDEVIRLIPRLIYADPRSRLENSGDAFDVAVEGVIERAEKLRREMLELEGFSSPLQESNSWKYFLVGSEGKHEWDHFFFEKKRS